MSIESARAYLEKFNVQNRIQEFDVSSATVALAAEALGCAPQRIAKTMAFLVDGAAILIVAPGDVKIDNSKFKQQYHTKAKMLSPDELVEMVGHAMGGVCPFGIKEGVTIYLDESLKRFETVFPACGSANSAIELTIPELEHFSGYDCWVDVCKLTEG